MRKFFGLCLLIIATYCHLSAQTIFGYVKGELSQPLAYSAVFVKGTSTGSIANKKGFYKFSVAPGTYTLVCQYKEHISIEKTITIENGELQVDFNLPVQQYNFSGSDTNTANTVINNAIRNRQLLEAELQNLQCSLYVRGELHLRDYPEKFMGRKIYFEDSTEFRKPIFLSEALAQLSIAEEADKTRVDVFAARMMGDSDGLALDKIPLLSFYHNIVYLNNQLNPRGFISPIADNAFDFYDYHFKGSFYDYNEKIYRIEVTPKKGKEYEPLFSGYINILDSNWHIYSLQLQTEKKYQLQVLDTLVIEQTYMPLQNRWIPNHQSFFTTMDLFGFHVHGSYLYAYHSYNLQPSFSKNYCNNITINYIDSFHNKSNNYWNTYRSVPLEQLNVADYKAESVVKNRNKPTWIGMLITGQNFVVEKNTLSYTVEPLIATVSYNTVEGVAVNISPGIYKYFPNRNELYISPNLRYGFNNSHLNAHITSTYTFGKRYENKIYFSGGRRVFQFNNYQPISPLGNTIWTLFFGNNYMKIYQADFFRIGYSEEFGHGIAASILTDFQNRFPLNNTTGYTWINPDEKDFTPNFPTELTTINIPHHQAFTVTLNFKWRPGTKYIQYPYRKVNAGSRYPAFELAFTKGLRNVLYSDVEFAKWRLAVYDEVNLHLLGELRWKVYGGGFINNNRSFIPDFEFFNGNKSFGASEYLNSFQLMPYYGFATTDNFFTAAHAEYHLNGFLSNKIPFFKKLNWFFVASANALYINENKQYYEAMFSIENILKRIRFDFVQSFEPNGKNTFGCRFAITGLAIGGRDD